MRRRASPNAMATADLIAAIWRDEADAQSAPLRLHLEAAIVADAAKRPADAIREVEIAAAMLERHPARLPVVLAQAIEIAEYLAETSAEAAPVCRAVKSLRDALAADLC